MITVLAFIFAIAVLVVFHEFGHYWVARRCGVKVLRFSVGFGKALYTKRFGHSETEWVISAVPLGGYVKMLDEREGVVAPHELSQAFNRKPVLQRMAIVSAGPLANFLLAIVLYWVLFMHGVPGLKPILGAIPAQTPAAAAQLQEQQTITRINGQAIASWDEARWILMNLVLQGADAQIETRTASEQTQQHLLSLHALTPGDLDGEFLQKLGLQPFQPLIQPVIGKISAGGAAQGAGLRADDRIVSVNGQAITRWSEFVEAVRSHPGQTLQLEIVRDNASLSISVSPEANLEAGHSIGKIGAAPRIDQHEFDTLRTEVRYTPLPALRQAMRKTWETSALSLKMLGKMIVGEISLKNLSGPITIADYAGQSAQLGVAAYLGFLALVSISLGVLNALPIPLLDGGHFLYYMVELIKGSPVSEKIWVAGQKVGIALLVTLMFFALYNDISRLVPQP
ncbi:MAG: RIP metalloprotease RseP [Gallionellaceae bacterium]|nr:RIP metalloprotease RseP [Gallionellaceae bacterium]